MLRELSVQNLALIEDVRVELEPGFCAWTGETGAGKSLLLGALGLLLGERGSADLLRAGADELRVTGRFEVGEAARGRIATVLDADVEDEIILGRRLNRAGRSHAYVNDQPVAIGTLKAIGALLVDIHGQRETATLLEPTHQLDLLDEYAGLHKPRSEYEAAAGDLRAARKRHAELSAARQQRQRELSLVRFEREELDGARLEPGEKEELARERDRLANAQELQAFAQAGFANLYEDEGSASDRLGKVLRDAERWAEVGPEVQAVASQMEGLMAQVRDVANELRRLGERWEADPARLGEVEGRLQLLKKLESKYRKSADELILYRLTLDEQEAKLQAEEDDLDGLEGELGKLFTHLKDAARELTRLRQKAARKFAAEVQKQLGDLGMADARLGADLTPIDPGSDPVTGDVPTAGLDQLELTLAANPGEPARPLRKVASGGELSRTMLALKTVLAGHDGPATMVFDEIDANVGARLGDVLGEKLAALGRSHQVICVTHLAPVASFAKHHWTIRKLKKAGRTTTQITRLEDGERLEELATMLRGDARGEATRKEVAEMLAAGRRRW